MYLYEMDFGGMIINDFKLASQLLGLSSEEIEFSDEYPRPNLKIKNLRLCFGNEKADEYEWFINMICKSKHGLESISSTTHFLSELDQNGNETFREIYGDVPYIHTLKSTQRLRKLRKVYEFDVTN